VTTIADGSASRVTTIADGNNARTTVIALNDRRRDQRDGTAPGRIITAISEAMRSMPATPRDRNSESRKISGVNEQEARDDDSTNGISGRPTTGIGIIKTVFFVR